MDETSWRFAQIVMWLIGAQSTILGGAFIFLWNNLSKKISDLDTKIDTQGIHFDMKMDKQAANFDLKMDKQAANFDLKMDKQATNFDLKMDKQATNFDLKMDKQAANFNLKMSELNAKIDKQGADFDLKLSSVLHLVNDIDKRLYGIETVLHMKDCCVLKQDQNLKKVE